MSASARIETGGELSCRDWYTIRTAAIPIDREKLAEYHELFMRLGAYPYDQDPLRPGWTPLIPNTRWADPNDDRAPKIPWSIGACDRKSVVRVGPRCLP